MASLYTEYNPIRSVDGKAIYCPSSYLWKLEDVSAPDAGRTEDTEMHKKRIGQIVGIELSWQNISSEVVAELLQTFNPEYIMVCYLNAMYNKYVTDEFYVGNRSAPLYNSRRGLWSSLSFNLIKRRGT